MHLKLLKQISTSDKLKNKHITTHIAEPQCKLWIVDM